MSPMQSASSGLTATRIILPPIEPAKADHASVALLTLLCQYHGQQMLRVQPHLWTALESAKAKATLPFTMTREI